MPNLTECTGVQPVVCPAPVNNAVHYVKPQRLADMRRDKSEGLAGLKFELVMASSYERLPVLLDWSGWIGDADWLRVLGEEWDGFDNIGPYADELGEAVAVNNGWDWDGGLIELLMDDAERQAFAQLPDVLTIYRGCYAVNKWGFSWSLDRDIAERFPFLGRYGGKGRPLLVKATIHKNKVAALKLGRGESEIVTFQRPKCISISTARKPADMQHKATALSAEQHLAMVAAMDELLVANGVLQFDGGVF